MVRVLFYTVFVVALMGAGLLQAQAFQVQLAAYNVQQPDSFFIERNFEDYMEVEDGSGIFWYIAGRYPTLEEAEIVHEKALANGFKNAYIIDEAAEILLADIDCPYIRDGVVFVHDPNYDPTVKTIYFDFGKSNLNQDSKAILDELYQKLKQNPALRLQIQGFTDGVGDARSNMKLAATRSRAARDYLIYKGVRADKMVMQVFGEAAPAAPNAEDDGSNAGKGRDLPENRKWNRRVTLTLQDPNNSLDGPK